MGSKKCERCGIYHAGIQVYCKNCDETHYICHLCHKTYVLGSFYEENKCFLTEPVIEDRIGCFYCGSPYVSDCKSVDGELLCIECAHREISDLVNDMDPDEIKPLLEQVKQHLKTDNHILKRIAIDLILAGKIKI